MGFMFTGLLFWVPFLAVPLVISIRALWLALTRPANYRAEPVCERCRYRVGGLSTFTCPECGTDLRRTGIITPAMEMRRRGSTVGAIAGWTLLMAFVGIMLGAVVSIMAFSRMAPAMAAGMSMVATTPLTSSTTLYRSLSITSNMSGGGVTRSDITVVLADNAGTEWTLTIDPNAQTSRVTDSAGTVLYTGAMGDEPDVKALYDSAKIDTTNVTIAAEIKELSKVLSATAMSSFTNVAAMPFKTLTPGVATFATAAGTTPNMSFVEPGIETIIVGLGYIVLAALWIGGIAFIVVRRKRLARELVQSELPPRPTGDSAGAPPPNFPAATPK